MTEQIQGKVWGTTQPLLVTPFIEIHRIFVKKGGYCSTHKHQYKYNMFYVIEGRLKVKIQKNDYHLIDTTKLVDDDFTVVSPNEYHWFEAEEDTHALEIYYPEGIKDDIIRENVGGWRPN